MRFGAFFVVLAASLSAVSLGLDVGTISSTLVQPSFLKYFNNPSSASKGAIAAVFSAGATFGAFGCALIADPWGRVWALRMGAVITIIGCGLQAGAVNLAMLIIGRLIAGFGAGQLTAVFPVYASETAPPAIRGLLGGLFMVMIEMAIFIATGAGYGFGDHYTSDAQWRGPLAVQATPLVLLIPITFFLPETPRWLASKDRGEEALKVIRKLHQTGNNEAFIQGEYQEIMSQIQAEKEMLKPSWIEVLRKRSWRRRVILAATLQTLAQFTGINCFNYYTSSIYEYLGFDHHQALQLNMIYGALGFVYGILWACLIDRFPRVRLLMVCTAVMAAACLVGSVLAAVYIQGDNATNDNVNALRAQVAMLFVFNLFFVAVGMLAWLIPPEMSPMVIRAKVNSVSVSVNNMAGLLVAEVSPIGLANIGFKFFYVFVACDIIAVPIYFFFFPETSKLTLEEMDVKFGDQLIDHVLQHPEKQQVDFIEHVTPAKGAVQGEAAA